MSKPRQAGSGIESSSALTAFQGEALRLLRQAAEAACEAGRDVWQFAVEIEQLRALGLNNTDLRRLLCRGYLQHAWELVSADDSQRTFQIIKTLALPERTCFVLTPCGLELLCAGSDDESNPAQDDLLCKRAKECPALPVVPHWDSVWRKLWWRNFLIKEFRMPASNQEIVLMALEEDGWPERIDDPLPHRAKIDPKTRLHDTIKALNHHHLHQLLRFHGDGKGLGIRWVLLKGS